VPLLNTRTTKGKILRAAVPVMFCVLVFLFALHAKTAVYGTAARSRVTPSTASKLWVSGQKMQAQIPHMQVAPLFWPLFLSLLGLQLLSRPRLQSALINPPPSNLQLWHLHRFLRPPPFQK
jgi:hypothetical protein